MSSLCCTSWSCEISCCCCICNCCIAWLVLLPPLLLFSELDFVFLGFLSILSDFLLREKLTKKWQVTKAKQRFFVQVYKLLTITQLWAVAFFVSFSHFCGRKSERIERKFKTQNPNLSELELVCIRWVCCKRLICNCSCSWCINCSNCFRPASANC